MQFRMIWIQVIQGVQYFIQLAVSALFFGREPKRGREKLAELTGRAFHCWNTRSVTRGKVELNDEEQMRLTQIEHEIGLFINPTEQDHRELMEALEKVLELLERGTDEQGQFSPALHKATMLGQKIFKTEWNRIKDDIEKP